MSERLRIALTKGRLQEKSVEMFEAAGLDCTPVRSPGRRLIHALPNYPLDVVLAKAPDVITYVEHGVCDLGVVGKDTVLEKGGAFYVEAVRNPHIVRFHSQKSRDQRLIRSVSFSRRRK